MKIKVAGILAKPVIEPWMIDGKHELDALRRSIEEKLDDSALFYVKIQLNPKKKVIK